MLIFLNSVFFFFIIVGILIYVVLSYIIWLFVICVVLRLVFWIFDASFWLLRLLRTLGIIIINNLIKIVILVVRLNICVVPCLFLLFPSWFWLWTWRLLCSSSQRTSTCRCLIRFWLIVRFIINISMPFIPQPRL